MHARSVWLAIGGIVVVHNTTASDKDTLSEFMDDLLLEHPWLWRAGIAAVALHLANAVPPKLDAIHWLFVLSRKWRRP